MAEVSEEKMGLLHLLAFYELPVGYPNQVLARNPCMGLFGEQEIQFILLKVGSLFSTVPAMILSNTWLLLCQGYFDCCLEVEGRNSKGLPRETRSVAAALLFFLNDNSFV